MWVMDSDTVGLMYDSFNNIFDSISKAAKNFQQEVERYTQERCGCAQDGRWENDTGGDYDWPPANIYTTPGAIVFEFGLAGFDEDDVNLMFQGDDMVLSALCQNALKKCGEPENLPEEPRFITKKLRLESIEKQKYYVPKDKYAQEKTKAVYKNGLLRVTIPLKEDAGEYGGVKIEIEH
jgi:HSP20 family molecular chaperone IbpA